MMMLDRLRFSTPTKHVAFIASNVEFLEFAVEEALSTWVSCYRRRLAAHLQRTDKLASGVAFVEGKLVPLQEARIPLIDQGFLHSDLTYDVIAVWDGRFFRLHDHLDRLQASCAKLRMRFPMPRADVQALLVDMIRVSGIRDAYVEIIVTRGMRFVRNCPAEQHVNVIYALTIPYLWVVEPELHGSGASAIVSQSVQRVPPGAYDPTIKNLQWGDLIRGMFEAADRGAKLPILPDGYGNIREGAGYNVFVVKDGVLRTPQRGVLEGITRRTVIEIAQNNGWPVDIGDVRTQSLYACDELFISTTAGGVMPITMLDGQPVGNGKPGAITRAIWKRYWELHADPTMSFAVDYGHDKSDGL